MSRRGGAFLSFITGIGIGTAIGILFAPEKGEVTREKLKAQLEKYKEQLKSFIENYKDENGMTADEFVTAAKSEGQKVVKDAKAQAEALLNDVEELIGQIKNNKNT